MLARLRPLHLWIVVAGLIGYALAGLLLRRSDPQFDSGRYMNLFAGVMATVLYSVGAILSWRISRDHRPQSAMRIAWVLMMSSSVAAAVRFAFESAAIHARWNNPVEHALLGLRQIPIVLSLVLLAASLAVMWFSFTSVGLGIKLRGADILIMGLIVLLVPPIVGARRQMADAQAAFEFVRYLQFLSPLLLAVPAALAIVLYRISREMGGGQYAKVLRCLVAFLLIRLVALMVGTVPALDWLPLRITMEALYTSVSAIFVLALVYRCEMRRSASEMVRRYEKDPAAELASLSAELKRFIR
jgi:hypothetical protein